MRKKTPELVAEAKTVHYTNIQPLTPEDNRRKGDKWDYFRERRKLRRFTRAWSKVSEKQHKKGNLNDSDYAKCKRAASDSKVMRKLMQKTETDPELKGGLKDLDWSKIFEWIEKNFWPLFKAILPLLLLLDERDV